MYMGVERRIILTDSDVTFEHFESQIRRVSGCGSSFIKTSGSSVKSCRFVPMYSLGFNCHVIHL